MASSRLKANEKVHYISSTTFTLDRRFSDLKIIGQGSYGVVVSARDDVLKSKVAIKKITPMCKDKDDAVHVLREIRLMRHMGKHVNIVSLEDLIMREAADELYIVMELLDSDLHRIIQSGQPLTDSHFKYIFFQLICGVKYLHDNRIIHRDLKPVSACG
jgi:serine/threonine protein kinase